MTADTIRDYITALITEGKYVATRIASDTGTFADIYVPPELFAKWTGGCRNLVSLLGSAADPWRAVISESQAAHANTPRCAKLILGALKSIAEAFDAGLLVRIESLVFAEAFANLLEQADYLLSEGYYLAAGVLGRAVLEEHLRQWCKCDECMPATDRPTLNDWNMALYKAKHLDKIAMKHVESLITIGNDAAHNKPGLKREDVERLLHDLPRFIALHKPA